jgi:predicted AlkP superfamily pyrophosphatase or phosphodiesterase
MSQGWKTAYEQVVGTLHSFRVLFLNENNSNTFDFYSTYAPFFHLGWDMIILRFLVAFPSSSRQMLG